MLSALSYFDDKVRKRTRAVSPVESSLSSQPQRRKTKNDANLEDDSNPDQLARVAQYVMNHFHLRKCSHYIPISMESDQSANNDLFKAKDCFCGRSFEWHSKRGLVSQVDKVSAAWSLDGDTFTAHCNAFGKMSFAAGAGFDESTIVPGASADYVRLTGELNSADSYLENVYTLLTSQHLWALPTPQLVIELVGTERKLPEPLKELVDRFTNGIISATKTAKAWIVTSGNNRGILGLVGAAVSKVRMTDPETKVTCLGIASWGTVNNRKQLISMDDECLAILKGEKPTNAKTEQNSDVSLTIEVSSEKGSTDTPTISGRHLTYLLTPEYVVERPERCLDGIPLNPSHNCFLFVDNGKVKRFGQEVDFKYRFLKYVCQKTFRGTGGSVMATPSVLLVVGGGTTVLRTVELSLGTVPHEDADRVSVCSSLNEPHAGDPDAEQPRWARPVIVFPNFGGVSELLAFAYAITAPSPSKDATFFWSATKPEHAYKNSQIPVDFEVRIKQHPAFEQLMQFVPERFRADEEEISLQRIRNCLIHRALITVVDLKKDSNLVSLDHVILDAILKSNRCPVPALFELSQLWNCSEIAALLLSRHEDEIRKQVDLKPAVTRAVKFGQSEFFKLFVDHGLANLQTFLTLRQIRTFYTDIFLKGSGKADKSAYIWLFRSLLLNQTTEALLYNSASPVFLKTIGNILSQLLGCYMDNVFTDERPYQESLEQFKENTLESTMQNLACHLRPYETSKRDLFILQLLLHRNDFASYVWKIGHDHLGTALMAYVFLKSLSKEAKRLDMTDVATAYHSTAKEWQDRAIALLSHCYQQDPIICSRLLIRSMQTWQGATLLEIAFYGNVKKFMEQPAVQTTLAQVWRGQMATFTSQPLIYLTLFPLLLPFLIFRIRFVASRATDNANLFRAESNNSLSTAKRRLSGIMPSATNFQNGVIKQMGNMFSPAPQQKPHDVRLTRASLFQFNHDDRISVPKAIYLLYSAPIAKYIVHSLTNFVFLFVFSSFVLVTTLPDDITTLEIVIWACCFIYFLDVIREGFGKTNLSIAERMQDFFFSVSDMAEVITLLLVTSAAILRIFWSTTVDYVFAHSIYVVACILVWLKSMRFFLVTESVGPKVITLVKMMRDLAFFLLIYVILLMSFSLPIHSLIYPDQNASDTKGYFFLLGDASYDILWNLFYTSLDDYRHIVEGTCESVVTSYDNSSSSNSTMMQTSGDSSREPCSSRNIIAITLYLIFLLLTNIMLLNMLVAMFSYTVDQTRLKAARRWRFDVYRFLCAYYLRPILPGPLMLPELIFRIIRLIYKAFCGSQLSENNSDLKHFYPSISDPEYRKLEMFERSAAEIVLARQTAN